MEKEILIFTLSLSNNGSERVFSELANEWAKKGAYITVVQFEEAAYGSPSFVLDKGIRLVTLNRRKIKNKLARYTRYYRDVKHYMGLNDDATVLAYSFTTQILVACASFTRHNRIVFSERNDPARCPYNRLFRFLRDLSFLRADRCVFQTNEAMNHFRKNVRDKGVVIGNPVNPNIPKPYEGERKKEIVTAARLRPQKNLHMLISAFRIFHAESPDYSLEIYGIGEQLDSLEELARAEGVEESVHFKGFSATVNEDIRKSAIYVCSSNYEGISNSVLEALSMGIPTISTDCPVGGSRQLIGDDERGYLTPVGDIDALARAMLHIATHPEEAASKALKARKLRMVYSVSRIAEKWLEII